MEEIKYTFCRVCEAACGLKATVSDGKLVKISGNKKHVVSKGYICHRGLATLDIHHDPDRIRHPMKQVNGRFEKVDWESALEDIGQKIRRIRERYGNDAIAYYVGNPIAFDYSLTAYNSLFGYNTLKTRNYFYAGSQDCNNKFAASEKMFGSQIIHPVPDIDHTDFLIIWGSNPAISKSTLMSLPRPEERLKAIEKRGGRIVIIDPRRTETADLVGEHIFIRPDTDIFLMMAMIHVIISKKRHNQAFVREYTTGFDTLDRFVSDYSPKKAAVITGIREEVIEQLAMDFANEKNAAIYASLGVNLGSFGTIGYWLIQCLNAITGRLDKKRSALIPMNMLLSAKLLRVVEMFRRPAKSRLGDFSPVMDALPAGIMADEILTPGRGQIKALIVLCGNPLLTVPDGNKLEKAFKSLDLLVSADLFVNETGGLAHYVLPGKDFYERWDAVNFPAMFNPVNALCYTENIVDAEGEQEELWKIFHDILMAAGYPLGGNAFFGKLSGMIDGIGQFFSMRSPVLFQPEILLKLSLLLNKTSFKKLKTHPHGLILGEQTSGEFLKWMKKRGKKIDLAPQAFLQWEGSIAAFFEKEKAGNGFKLIGQRERRTHNSWFHNVDAFLKKEKTNMVSLNREDAKDLGVEEGNIVEIKNENGKIRLPAKIVDTLLPGVIAIPHGWGHGRKSGLTIARKKPGANVNLLTASGPDHIEPVCGMSKLTGIPVEVRKVIN